MKKIIIGIFIIACIVGGYVFSRNTKTEESIQTEAVATSTPTNDTVSAIPKTDTPVISGSYTVDTVSSKTTWSGKKPLKENWTDTGTVPLQSGTFTLKDGTFSSGTLVFNMKDITVTNTGMGATGVPMLEKHLKSKDFFKVDAFPTARFVLTKGDSTSVTGQLTLLDVTKEIVIPVTVSKIDGKVRIVGQTKIDRTLFGIKYGSSSFFDNLKDNVIDNNFFFDFDIIAQ